MRSDIKQIHQRGLTPNKGHIKDGIVFDFSNPFRCGLDTDPYVAPRTTIDVNWIHIHPPCPATSCKDRFFHREGECRHDRIANTGPPHIHCGCNSRRQAPRVSLAPGLWRSVCSSIRHRNCSHRCSSSHLCDSLNTLGSLWARPYDY